MGDTKGIYEVLAEVQDVIEQPKLNASVSYGNTKFRYADLPEIWRVIRKATQGRGLFIHNDTVKDADGAPKEVVTVVHFGMQTAVLAAVPANMFGKPQDVGSAITYAKRYSLAMAFGLCADEDDDGKRAEGQGVKRRKTAAEVLNDACKVYASNHGVTVEEAQEVARNHSLFVQGDDKSYRAVANILREA